MQGLTVGGFLEATLVVKEGRRRPSELELETDREGRRATSLDQRVGGGRTRFFVTRQLDVGSLAGAVVGLGVAH